MIPSDRLSLVAITKNGAALAEKARALLGGGALHVSGKFRKDPPGEASYFDKPLRELIGEIWPRHEGHVFFVSLGAIVRLIADHVKDKRVDPAVVVVDDQAKFVIAVLSGHLGGANELAERLASLLGATPVVTTASDVGKTIGVDILGREFGWRIEDPSPVTAVSAAVVNEEKIGFFQDAGEPGWWTRKTPLPANISIHPTIGELKRALPSAALLVTDRILTEQEARGLPRHVLYRPRTLVLGMGCDRGVTLEEFEELVEKTFRESGLSRQSIARVATIDLKKNEEAIRAFAEKYGIPVDLFTREELSRVADLPNPSAVVKKFTGTPGVSEPSALLASGAPELLVPKRKAARVTLAVARIPGRKAPAGKGALFVVGFGPGSHEHLTYRARKAIEEAEVVVGYRTYIDLVKELARGKEIISTGMQEEIERARRAVELAKAGRKVAIVSSGDPGIYGMAGLVYEVLKENGWRPSDGFPLEIVPGVPAFNAVAALLGAPLMHDFAGVSLSDLLTPWETIAERLDAAGRADFVIALYNPKSGRRTWQIAEAQKILRKYRAGTTPVGIVKGAYRIQEEIVLTDLDRFLDHEIGMLTTLLVGNSATFVYEGKMITPRGYHRKYGTDSYRTEGTIAADTGPRPADGGAVGAAAVSDAASPSAEAPPPGPDGEEPAMG